MAKMPSERYSTARELADDLRCFLNAKPIRARRASLLQRFNKWTRRHRGLVAATATIVLLVAIGLAIGLYLLWQQDLETQRALKEARDQRQAAEMNYDMAFVGMDSLIGLLYLSHHADTPQLQEIRQLLTNQAISFYESLLGGGNTYRTGNYQTGHAYHSLGILYATIGKRSKALEAHSKAVAIFDALTQEHPEDASLWFMRGGCHADLSLRLVEINHLPEAAEQRRLGAHAFEQAQRLNPNDHRYPNSLATLWLNSNDPADRSRPEVVAFARKALELDQGNKDNWNMLGAALYYAGEWQLAVRTLETSLRLEPTSRSYRADSDDSICRCFLAMAQWKLGNKTEARQNYDRAVQWIDSNNSPAIGNIRFRKRAAEVLDVHDR
jgi:tetratricopeptide (TPR) repeat protein